MKRDKCTPPSRFLQSGLFQKLGDWSTFIHKIVLNIRFVNKPILGPGVRKIGDYPIARQNSQSIYGRRLDVLLNSSENPASARYVKLKNFENVPPVQVEIRSEKMPLTGIQLIGALEGLTGWSGEPLEFSLLEITADVTGFPVSLLRRQAFFRANCLIDKRDGAGRETFYAGTKASPRQACVYQKQDPYTRIEERYRGKFLRDQGIYYPKDILRLADSDFPRIIKFCDCDLQKLKEVHPPVNGWRIEAQDLLFETARFQQLAEILRTTDGFDLEPFLKEAAVETLLREMRMRFLW